MEEVSSGVNSFASKVCSFFYVKIHFSESYKLLKLNDLSSFMI